MTYVVDASFVMSFLLPDEQNSAANLIFQKYINQDLILIAPVLLPFEVLNGLKMAVKRKRISEKEAVKLMKLFLNYKIDLAEVDFEQVFDLAIRKKLTVYDASYLALAKIKHAPLLTCDENLQKTK